MDSVRFGRALGIGARSAAKALAGAVDAATAPNPNPVKPPPAAQHPRRSAENPVATSPSPAVPGPIASAAKAAARATVQARETRKGIARGSKRFGESVWGPFARLSSVLWLEITGSFFGIFALFAGTAAWSHRADLHPAPLNHDARLHLFVFAAMALLFGYFCISSFLRAYRK